MTAKVVVNLILIGLGFFPRSALSCFLFLKKYFVETFRSNIQCSMRLNIFISIMEDNKTSKTQSKIKPIAYWISTGIIALESGAGAQWDLSRNDFVKKVFVHLGYPEYLLTILGVWKILAFIAILIPRFPLVKEWAYAGLFFSYSGAVASHIAVGDDISVWTAPAIFTLITVASWALRPAFRSFQG
jgi:hypothetical protein